MGKTLSTIIEVGAIAGLAVVTFGVGAGLAAGWTLAASVAAVGGTLGIGAAGVIGVAALGAESIGALTASTPKPSLTETPLKSPTPPRKSGYGVGRMQPTWALYDVAPDGWAVDCYAFHDGQINRVIDHYIGDKRVSLLVGGFVQELDGGAFKGNNNVVVGNTMGLPTETAFSQVIAKIPDHWTVNHRGDGVVTGFMLSKNVKSKNWQGIYSLGGPNNAPLSMSMERQLIYDWRDETQSVTDPTTWKYSENAWLHLAHYLLIRKDTSPPRLSSSMDDTAIAAAKAAYWTRVGAVWAMKFAPTIDAWTAAADDADTTMPLKGVQTILAGSASEGDTSVNVYSTNGLAPGMTIAIYISGDNSKTEARVVTSISGALVHFSDGLAYDHPQSSQVTWNSDPDAPATEPRYRGCVTHAHNEAHKDVITRLLACGDGYLTTRSDGAYVLYSGVFTAPTVDVGPRDVIAWSLQKGVNEEDAINTLKVTYVSVNHDYSVVDTDDWVDEDDLDARGKELSDSFQAETPSFSQNRRLAKRVMAKRMAPYRGTVVISGRRRDVQSQRYINLDLTEAGETFFNGAVELSNGKRLIQTGAYQYDFVAIDASIDEWTPATEEGNPAPVGNRVAVQPLPTPTITAATPNFGTDSATGVAGVFIDLTAEGPPADRDDVTWYAQTRVVGASTWGERTYSDVPAGASVDLATEFVPADASVEVQVSYSYGDGRLSDWSDTFTVDTASSHVPPARVTGLAATDGVGKATVVWNNPVSVNLASENVYASTTDSFGSASIVGSFTDLAGTASSHDITLAADAWFIWCTTVSTTGAESTPVGPVTATVT